MPPRSRYPPHPRSRRMKTGMNLLLWTGHVTEEHFPLLAKLKAAGYDGVEIPVFEADPNHYRKVRAELDRNGLKCTTVTIVSPEANPISPDANVRAAAADLLKKVIECNHVLGAGTMVGPFLSPLGGFAGEPPPGDEKNRAADALRQAAE